MADSSWNTRYIKTHFRPHSIHTASRRLQSSEIWDRAMICEQCVYYKNRQANADHRNNHLLWESQETPTNRASRVKELVVFFPLGPLYAFCSAKPTVSSELIRRSRTHRHSLTVSIKITSWNGSNRVSTWDNCWASWSILLHRQFTTQHTRPNLTERNVRLFHPTEELSVRFY